MIRFFLIIFVGLTSSNALADPIWTESFDTGIGRLDHVTGEGESRFPWSSGGYIEADFFRNHSSTQRYAELSTTFLSQNSTLGFSVVVHPLSADGESVNAVGQIGFLNSGFDNSHNSLTIAMHHSDGEEFGRFSIRGHYESGAEVQPTASEEINFSFGTTYFLDAVLDGPNHEFSINVYEGINAQGIFVGMLTHPLNQTQSHAFDALGLTNVSAGGGDRSLLAQIHEISFTVPEPSTAMLLGLMSLCTFRRRRVCN